jgi:hypothetical protein
MGDLEVTGIYMCLEQGQDPYHSVGLTSFIWTRRLAKAGIVQGPPLACARARGKVRRG